MIEANNPEVNVDDLMVKVKEEVARKKNQSLANQNLLNTPTAINVLENSRIESLLNDVEINSQKPNKLPHQLNIFPFKFKLVKAFLFKLYGFVFKKQHSVNLSLLQAIKELQKMNQKFTEGNRKLSEQLKVLKIELAQYKRSLATLSKEAKKRLPEPFTPEQIKKFAKEEQHLLDAFYVAFEERFRGSCEEITNRLRVYLPLIGEAKIGKQEAILDLGCGRGEWLQLLREEGYTAKGVDSNRVMIEQCRSQELNVDESDVIEYLQSLPNDSLGIVTGFHLIEHLPFPVLIKLLNETLRVLKSGGIAIFETPNPQNILVGSKTFYFDPTHRNPLPSELSQFLLENAGFEPVVIVNLNPYKDSLEANNLEVTERFNEYFYCSQDYAVIGYK